MANAATRTEASEPIADRHSVGLYVWCVIAAFGTYFCMYAFRKPFTASKYEGLRFFGDVDFKTILVSSQVMGYMLSKFLGIKVIAELTPQRRILGIITLIAIAEAALLGFAVIPQPWNCTMLFINGLPLGMVFGMVLAFLEGRRVTELLMATLCASFILADGAAKSVGAFLLSWNVPENWMPFTAGLLATLPMSVFVWMLSRIPAPTPADVAQRAARVPMDARQRWRFFRTYAIGLSAIVAMYMLITVLRSIRSDFAAEIWSGLLGQEVRTPPEVFTTTEVFVALAVMLANGMCFVIKNSRTAFYVALSIAAAGAALIVAGVVGLRFGVIGPFAFMVFVGIGLYLPYVAVHTTIFERLIAITRDRSNLGYLMYLADAFGYLGYPLFMLIVRRFTSHPDFLKLFTRTSMCMAIASLAAIVTAGLYFRNLFVAASQSTEQ